MTSVKIPPADTENSAIKEKHGDVEAPVIIVSQTQESPDHKGLEDEDASVKPKETDGPSIISRLTRGVTTEKALQTGKQSTLPQSKRFIPTGS